jgi:hypothetical protein
MALSNEKVRQAKKYLENKKISIKHVKPRLFAIAANSLQKNFDETLEFLTDEVNGTFNSNNKK